MPRVQVRYSPDCLNQEDHHIDKPEVMLATGGQFKMRDTAEEVAPHPDSRFKG